MKHDLNQGKWIVTCRSEEEIEGLKKIISVGGYDDFNYPHKGIIDGKVVNGWKNLENNNANFTYIEASEVLGTTKEEEQYTKIEPKVGDKFRVIKDIDIFSSNPVKKGMIIEMKNDVWDIEGRKLKGIVNFLTTEYLNPVEEKIIERTIEDWNKQAMHFSKRETMQIIKEFREYKYESIKHNKKTIMTIPKAIKKLLSKDLQALYKTGRINNDLELSNQGRQEYTNALFSNDGDHKAAKAEMVAEAKEEIEEAKE